jgi:hypothetical protein
MKIFQKEKDRKAWLEAQRTHQLEHASGVEPTLSCEAVGHYDSIDEYGTYFDKDVRRKFCIAAGRPW